MKTLIITHILIYFFILPNSIRSQRRNNDPNSEIKNSRSLPQNDIASPIKNIEKIRRGKSPNRPKSQIIDSNKSEKQRKKIAQRPPRNEHPKKTKKPQVIDNNLTVFIYESIEIENNIYQSTSSCGENIQPDDNIKIAEYPYPDFPLRFSRANINYKYTSLSEDIYELSFVVNATHNDYFNKFGLLLTDHGGFEKILIFNEELNFLDFGDNYKFNTLLCIENTGYLNLRLGYFDDDFNIFYPEEFIPNKTDRLIYIEKGAEVSITKISNNR